MNIKKIINEELDGLNYVYHGTNVGAGYHIQRSGGMKLNAANNNEPYISFTSKLDVANYYAKMKGGSDKGVVLRTKLNDNFKLSPKYNKNDDGFEQITSNEIPVDLLEIKTKYGWIPLNNWDFIENKIIN